MKRIIPVLALIASATPADAKECCDKHGGVQTCQYGLLICYDGYATPSCVCVKVKEKKFEYTKKPDTFRDKRNDR